jgi:hypothetical protein
MSNAAMRRKMRFRVQAFAKQTANFAGGQQADGQGVAEGRSSGPAMSPAPEW